MSVSVTCPFCRSVFALADIPAARRTPCPNCGESVSISADAADAAPAADPPEMAPPVAPPPRKSSLVFVSLGLTTLIVAGFAAWFFFGPKAPERYDPPPTPTTVPPRALGGLKYIPKDSQIVAAVQPAALDQYAKGKGRKTDELLAEFGVPEGVVQQLRDAGLPPEAIQSVVVAAQVDDLKVVLVLTLREPLKDEGRFRDKLKVQGRDPATVDLSGFPLPLFMTEVNEKTFVFAVNEKDLAAAKAPSAGYDDLRPAVRESVDKLSPAALAWVATDSKEWAKLPLLKLVPKGVLPADVLPRLDGVRAAAVGVSLDPELRLFVGVRVNDSTVARDTADALRTRLADVSAYVTPSGEWADTTVYLDPTKDTLPKLKDALRK